MIYLDTSALVKLSPRSPRALAAGRSISCTSHVHSSFDPTCSSHSISGKTPSPGRPAFKPIFLEYHSIKQRMGIMFE